MVSFIAGVLASLLAAFLVFVIVQIRTQASLSWVTFRAFWQLSRRLRQAGVVNFFSGRSDYYNFRKERTISEYILTAQKSLVYVGFWLAQGVEIDDAPNALGRLLRQGCTVELVLLDQELDDAVVEPLSAYLSVAPAALRARIAGSWAAFTAMREQLPGELRPFLILRTHRDILTSSAFIFDYGAASAKTLIDVKFFGMGREQCLGIELRPSGGRATLYHNVTSSFLEIKKRSELV